MAPKVHNRLVATRRTLIALINCAVFYLSSHLVVPTHSAHLSINLQNKGGEVIQESITSNSNEDFITLEFQKSDGTYITQVIDFRNEVRIMKALILGEEERGQSNYQVVCFVTKHKKDDFMLPEDMVKLRQRNPQAVRVAEEDKGLEVFEMTSWVHLSRAHVISRHLQNLCSEAANSTYMVAGDIKAWSELPGSSMSKLEAATVEFPRDKVRHCNERGQLNEPCMCTLKISIYWYPCGLKYCKDRDSLPDQQANYRRCGIKTCRKSTRFLYYVKRKHHCIWDD